MIVLYWLLKRLGSKLAGQPISPRFLWELFVKENQPRPLGFLAVFKPVAARLLPLKETVELPRIKPIGFNSTNPGSSLKETALKPHQKPIGYCSAPLYRFPYKGIHPASLGFYTVLNPEISQRFSLRETEESQTIKPIGFCPTIYQEPLK
jgi:hypothetical protein